jgi:hypothetical protein
MATLEQILSGKNLSGLIQSVKSGIPIRIPAAFLNPNRTIKGNTGKYRKVEGTREVARIVQYGSPAERRAQKGISEVPFVCMHSFEKQAHELTTLINLLDAASDAEQQMGRSEVTRQTTLFKQLFMNLRIAAVTMALSKFHIYADSNGNLQTGSSGAAIDVDYGVPSTHYNSGAAGCNPLGANIITAQWDLAATDIIGQLRELKQAAVNVSGYPLRYAFYGDSIPGWIAANTTASNYMQANGDLSRQFIETGEVPNGFMGLQWVPLGDAFFVDENGAVQNLVADDEVIFTPEPSLDWYELVQGTFPVPTNFGSVVSDVQALISGVQQVAGMFSYAAGEVNPPSATQYAGDTFLPLIKVPGALYKFDTDW